MNIQLITMMVEDVERNLKESSTLTFRSYQFTPGAVPPVIVFTSALERRRAGESWFWCAPRLFYFPAENLIIGSGCFKNSPDNGEVEIGCGVAESHRRRNLATEGVRLLLAEAFSKPEVTAVTAETAVGNTASGRVLEKAGFIRTGRRDAPEDGPVITWRRERQTE
ncbi:MAG: GNAT family N-acetyltransferase [Candidatus Zixiibacteriota bacterium]